MDTVKCLTTLPSTDGNFLSALASASLAQLKYAVQIMKLNDGGNNASRIKVCEKKIKEFDAPKAKATTKKKDAPKTTSSKASEPKKEEKPKELEVKPLDKSKRPKVIPFAKSNGNHTYNECKAKLEAELKKFTDNDSAYVVEGVLERCQVDKDFCNNVMRKDKSYEGFFKFMFKAALNGYCYKVGNGGILDKDDALELAFDYFNGEEEKTTKTTTVVSKESVKKANTDAAEEMDLSILTKKAKEKKPEPKKEVEYEQLSLFEM